jgi:hypothetical protein
LQPLVHLDVVSRSPQQCWYRRKLAGVSTAVSCSLMTGGAEHCSFVLLADFDIARGAQLTYQFPQPLGTDETSVTTLSAHTIMLTILFAPAVFWQT